MLLRRVTQHIKDQNWFAVFVDFFIVVVGVFIGIQVNNWNESRKDKTASYEYIQRLKSDVQISLDRNQYQISNFKRNIKELNLVLKSLESCALSTKEEPIFAAGIYNMGKYDLPVMVMRTIDELNSVGKFSIVGNAEIRQLITEVIRELDTTKSIDGQISSRTIPNINFIKTRFRFTLDKHLTQPESISPDKIHYDLDTICQNPEMINAVANVREMTLAIIALNQRTYDMQSKVLEAINDLLNMQAGI